MNNFDLFWDTASRPMARTLGDPAPKKMDQRWADLASDDGMISFKAMGEMIGTPAETVKFLGTKLKPVPPIDAAVLQKLVEDLDSPNFGTRQKASKELEKLEGVARPALEKALVNPVSAEMQTRIKKLLDRLDAPVTSPEELRTIRAVEVLERIATPEARDLLARLAKGAPGARLTKESSESLARLTK